MEDWLSAPWPVLLKTFVSCIGIMVAVLLVVRLYGLRSLAKMSSIDFASTVAVGSILASVAISTNQSLLKGAVALMTIIGFQQLFSYLKRKSDWLENTAENSPIFLMQGEEILTDNLAACRVTHADLMAKLREANVFQFSEVAAVVFETTGDISVLHRQDDTRVQEDILRGVRLQP